MLRLAPDVPGLEALGARELDDFLCEPPRVATSSRARRAGDGWRVPLPGTPDEHGVQHEKPRGAGTGQLIVRAWRSSPIDLLRARMSAPRSTSVAARHWNLICHLQAHGVGAPQLVALGERDSQSCLIVRELADFTPLANWRTAELDADARERSLRSLELAIDALARCGAWLPESSPDNVLIQSEATDCAAIQIANLASERAVLGERGLERARLPAIAFTRFDGGRIYGELPPSKRERLRRALGTP